MGEIKVDLANCVAFRGPQLLISNQLESRIGSC